MTELSSGDSLTMSITHHVTINSDDAWIKLEANIQVKADETGDEAFNRVNDYLQDKIMTAIESSAQTVIDYEKGH